jgi:hypothetical protein
MAQIRVEKLTKTFRIAERRAGLAGAFAALVKRTYRNVQALVQVDFQIEAGELVGYIGPNGAGKSTTIKILSGISFVDLPRGVPALLYPGDSVSLYQLFSYCRSPENCRPARLPGLLSMAVAAHRGGVLLGCPAALEGGRAPLYANRKLVELHLAANTIRWREIGHGAALQIAASQIKGTGGEHPCVSRKSSPNAF